MACIIDGITFLLKSEVNYENRAGWLIIFEVMAEAGITSASVKRSCL